ncbi:unnamed protein product [Acanthosepion pharaonis]|uniref:Uncharacterized protein n=1 Tax=Acanthosepion pharaonis TaxID=158019 RepID=A0A812C1Y2_ACAPH|nr:unnamed protein product [Sepia pharaonis]
MDIKDTEDIKQFMKELIPETFILDDIQESKEPCGNVIALKDKRRITINLVHQLEARLMLVKSWINGNEDQLSKDIENGTANQENTSSKKKECEQIAQEIRHYCDKLETEYEILQLKEKLLIEKVSQIKLQSEKCEHLKQEKWGKMVDILGPNMPQQLSNFDEQLKLKVENAQQVYKTSRTNLKSLKVKVCELKTSCEELLQKLQQKEEEYKILKKEQDEKTSRVQADFDISEKMINIYQTFSNVSIEKSGKNFIQVKMTSEIGEAKSLLVTLYFKPSDYQGILLSDIHVSNNNLYITDCVENVRSIQNIPACLNSIKERWHYYLRMAEHLKDIQERLPVDWIQQENKLRVVVGKNANIICTLQLPSAYQSWVSLLNVKGGDSQIKIDLLKPSNPKASLQEWIQYLEEKFS